MLLLHSARPNAPNRPHGPKKGDSTPEPHLKLKNMGYEVAAGEAARWAPRPAG